MSDGPVVNTLGPEMAHPAQLTLILGQMGTGKTTLSKTIARRAVIVQPSISAVVSECPTFIVDHYPSSVPFKIAQALQYMKKINCDCLILDDCDTLWSMAPNAIEFLVSHCRNAKIKLIAQAKTPVRISPFIRDAAQLLYVHPGRELIYRHWMQEMGLPQESLNPFWFYGRRGIDLFLVDNRLTSILRQNPQDLQEWIDFDPDAC